MRRRSVHVHEVCVRGVVFPCNGACDTRAARHAMPVCGPVLCVGTASGQTDGRRAGREQI